MFGQLYFECIEKKSHNGSQQLYKNYIRKLEDIPMIEVNPRNRYPVFERNYLEKFNIPKGNHRLHFRHVSEVGSGRIED
jgi:hypothetical protein